MINNMSSFAGLVHWQGGLCSLALCGTWIRRQELPLSETQPQWAKTQSFFWLMRREIVCPMCSFFPLLQMSEIALYGFCDDQNFLPINNFDVHSCWFSLILLQIIHIWWIMIGIHRRPNQILKNQLFLILLSLSTWCLHPRFHGEGLFSTFWNWKKWQNN